MEKSFGISSCKCKVPGDKTIVCPHVYAWNIDHGIKRFTGQGQQKVYLCPECDRRKAYIKRYRCSSCVDDLDIDFDWSVKGFPEILRDPKNFSFSSRELVIPELANAAVLSMKALPHHRSDLLVFTDDGRLGKLNLRSGQYDVIGSYSADLISTKGRISLSISRDQRFAALTSCVRQSQVGPSNGGLIIDLHNGAELMPLACGDYHTEEADFPVAFIEHGGNTLVIHATEWNHLDVTDPVTGECLTHRDIDTEPWAKQRDSENIVFTEWNGKLSVSPNQRRVATIGWVWHPVGVAYSWDAKKWLGGNRWESDFGKSKRRYVMWAYFWHAPFFWIDDRRLCIWGFEDFHTERDIPLPSAAIYDAETGRLLSCFAGPTMDLFVFDTYLFSGRMSGGGITVWSVDSGALLHEHTGIRAQAYHPGTRQFIEVKSSGVFLLHHWHLK